MGECDLQRIFTWPVRWGEAFWYGKMGMGLGMGLLVVLVRGREGGLDGVRAVLGV